MLVYRRRSLGCHEREPPCLHRVERSMHPATGEQRSTCLNTDKPAGSWLNNLGGNPDFAQAQDRGNLQSWTPRTANTLAEIVLASVGTAGVSEGPPLLGKRLKGAGQ